MTHMVKLWDLLYLYRAIVLFEGHASFLGADSPTQATSEVLCRLIEAWQPILDSNRPFFARPIAGSSNDDNQDQVGLDVTKAQLLLLEHIIGIIIEHGKCRPEIVKVHIGPVEEVTRALTRCLNGIRMAIQLCRAS